MGNILTLLIEVLPVILPLIQDCFDGNAHRTAAALRMALRYPEWGRDSAIAMIEHQMTEGAAFGEDVTQALSKLKAAA